MKLKIIIFLLLLLLTSNKVIGQTEEQLQAKINASNQTVSKLEEEIKEYEKKLNVISNQRQTLDREFSTLEVSFQKLSTDIAITEEKINTTSSRVEKIEENIISEEERIEEYRATIAEGIRKIKYNDRGNNILEIVLSYNSFSEYVQDQRRIEQLLDNLNSSLENIRTSKKNLEKEKETEIIIKEKLATAEKQLYEQQQIIDQNKQEKAVLLNQTRNQESSFQNMLAERERMRSLIEAEIRQAEEELRILIDPDSFPRPGSQIFSWPLDNIRITQYFGLTSFAQRNTGLYGNSGHNGIDLAASVGTAIKSPAAGVITGVGDTDLACRGASYGKWMIVNHLNGLSTMYAHLSLARATAGQKVERGEVIGWTGNTGYSTGPHLHFSVMVTEGTEIGSLQSRVPGCGVYRLPLGAPNAFLNPLDYLTKI